MTSDVQAPERYPEFNPNVHQATGPSLEVLQTRKREHAKPRGRTTKRWSEKLQDDITIFWLCRAAHNFDHERAVAERDQTEQICFAEAESLGLCYVVIRQGIHNQSAVYENGMPATFFDLETQRWETKIDTVSWHITVWMGNSKHELLIHGHIVIDWDDTSEEKFGRMTKPGKPSGEYWSLTKVELLPKEVAQ